MPAFIVWTTSPVRGISTTTVVWARVAISTSLCPAPTVSTNTTSMPSASSTRTASNVARASPPACPRVAMDRMKTPGSTPVSAMRMRSPSTAPPEYGDVGSTATTPTFLSFARNVRTRRLISELFPAPGGPVNPTTWARPVCGKIRATASTASASSSSMRDMIFPAARLSPRRSARTSSGTESRGRRGDALRRVTASRPFARLLEERDDLAEGRPGTEHHPDARLLQLRDVLLRDDPSGDHDDVARLPLPEQLDDGREEGHVGAAQRREANRVDVLLDRGFDDVLRRLPQAGVDDLHPGVPQRARDDLGAAVMPIQAGLRDEHADLLRHGASSVEQRFLPDAEDLAHHVADLAERRLRAHGLEDHRHRVVVAFARRAETVQRAGMLLGVPKASDPAEPLELSSERRLGDAQRLDLGLLVDGEVVDADDRSLPVLDFPLVAVRGVRDLLLEEPFADRRDDTAEAGDAIEVAVRVLLELVREGLEEVRPAERVDRVRDAALVRQDLLRPEGDPRGFLVRHLVRLVVRVRVQRLRAAENRGEGLHRRAHDVDLRLLGRQAHAGRLRVEPQEPRARILRAEGVAHLPRPDPPGGPVLRELLEEVVVRVEEERQAGREVVDRQATVDPPPHVLDAVREGEGELLRRGGARLADVVPADRDRVPLRHLRGTELERVDDEPHRGLGREDPLLLRLVLLQDVVLDRAAERGPRRTAFLGHREVHRPDHARRRIDRHRRAHVGDVNPVEQDLHVLEGRDRHAARPELAFRLRVVRVVPVQRGHVERDAQARLAVRDEVLEPRVRVLGAPVAGEHPHRPEAASIHRGVDAAGEGELAGRAETFGGRLVGPVEGRIDPLDCAARGRQELFAALREDLEGILERRLLPPLPFLFEGSPLVRVPHETSGGFKRRCL